MAKVDAPVVAHSQCSHSTDSGGWWGSGPLAKTAPIASDAAGSCGPARKNAKERGVSTQLIVHRAEQVTPTTQVDRDAIFLLYALVESGRALKAFDEIRALAAARVTRVPGVEVRENQTVFDAIRMALQFSANVSRVFWPSSKSTAAQERGRRLREQTGLADDHPLKLRTLRNHIEHMDERLDDWTANSPRSFCAIEMVLNADFHPDAEQAVRDSCVVIYMEANNSVYLFGEKFCLTDLRTQVLDVQCRISRRLEQSRFDPEVHPRGQ